MKISTMICNIPYSSRQVSKLSFKINIDVVLYKMRNLPFQGQYEALLQEYTQYLDDLETLQKKSDNLEKLKGLFEQQIVELKAKSQIEAARYN